MKADTAQTGRLHRYANRLAAFEHAIPTPPKNILLWVGGLGDGLLTVSYPAFLSQELPPGWGLVQVSLLSSLNGWGTGSLQRDAGEISQCASYFRKLYGEGTKIVLMGHSTGCQDAMEYVTGKDKETRTPLDGIILQAPVSDREAFGGKMRHTYNRIVEAAKTWVEEGQSEDVMPNDLGRSLFNGVAITAYRWLSLLSPDKDGDDDYFSSDLPDGKLQLTFGTFPKSSPLLILFSGSDEHVPSSINVPTLIERWRKHVEDGGGVVDIEHGGIVPNAHHNLEQDSKAVVDDLCKRVHGFLESIEDQKFQSPSSQL